jgi:hypothetical protein
MSDIMIHHLGIDWILYHGALLPDAAPHVAIDLQEIDLRFMLAESGARLIRWSSHFDMEQESSFWYVIKDNPASLEELSKNSRNQVRKGLKNCLVRPLPAADLAQIGFEVYHRAMTSYNTDLQILTESKFQSYILDKGQDGQCEFWGVFNEQEELVAYAQNRIQNESCNYQVMKLDPQYLSLYPSYALVYEMNRHYLNERNLLYVNDGARSIRHDTNIQDFLIKKFKFRRAYSRLHVRYDRKTAAAVNCLYPLRSLVRKLPGPLFSRTYVLLRQEEIRRSFG